MVGGRPVAVPLHGIMLYVQGTYLAVYVVYPRLRDGYGVLTFDIRRTYVFGVGVSTVRFSGPKL